MSMATTAGSTRWFRGAISWWRIGGPSALIACRCVADVVSADPDWAKRRVHLDTLWHTGDPAAIFCSDRPTGET